MSGTAAYLDMQRACYADLASRSRFDDERFTGATHDELVVGWYARHERFDYERWLFGGVSIDAHAVAIDYGCGPGRMIRRLAPRFARIDGADISADVIDVARRRCAGLASPPELTVTRGDGLPAGCEGRYDVAYSVICLQHICVHRVRRAIFESLFAALKPGGLLTFQMGYGPGHPALADYYEDRIDAEGSNGAADVTVLHPDDLASDLEQAGFDSEYALTPAGPGDPHAAWIFVRAWKPGCEAAVTRGATPRGFQRLERDPDGAAHARAVRDEHSIAARHVDLQARLAAAEVALTDARAETEEARAEIVMLQVRAEALVRQLRRVQTVDRPRLRELIDDLVDEMRRAGGCIGIFGAGSHTEHLLADTSLGRAPQLVVFDADPRRAGTLVGGIVVRPAARIADAPLDAVVISSLAFEDEMVAYVQALAPRVRIVRCY